MNPEKEDFLKRADEILDNIYCWNGLEDEVLKLFCLFSNCVTTEYNGQEFVHINYVREKIKNILVKHPIILSPDAARMFCSIKIEQEKVNNGN